MAYFGVSGSTVTYNQYVYADKVVGPSSYPTGGFVIDCSVTVSSLNFLKLALDTLGNLPCCRVDVTLNSPANGKATVKLLKLLYTRVASFGNVQSQPAGVTIQTASGQTSSSESSHTHAIDHDHPSFTSAAPTASGGSVNLNAVGPNMSTHTHTLDLPNFTGTSGAGSSHNHTDNTLYDHRHVETHTNTDFTETEVSNGTDLSGTIWNVFATGVKI